MSELLVTLPDGSEIEHTLAGRTTLGSGERADVRLRGVEELELEHLLLVPQKDGCWIATARGARTPLLRDGAVVGDGLVPWGTRLTLGASTIDVGGRPASSSGRMRPVLLALALAVLALFAFASMRSRAARAAALARPATAPASLFDEPRPCSVDGSEAHAEAVEALRAGRARGERFHYDYQDGIAGVTDYQRAEACFLAAGEVPWAERAGAEGRALRDEIESTHRRLRLSLEQLLDREDDAAALETLRELRELTRHRRDERSAELAELERELQLELGLLTDDEDD